MMLTIVMLTMLLSLSGCFFPHPWHDGGGRHDRGGGRGHDKGGYSHHIDGRHDHDRDDYRYERR